MYLNQPADTLQSPSVLFRPCLSLTNTLSFKIHHPMLSLGESPAGTVTITLIVQWSQAISAAPTLACCVCACACVLHAEVERPPSLQTPTVGS